MLNGRGKLFEGLAQYERFTNIFHEIVRSAEPRQFFVCHGIHSEYFGTHCIPKGAVTHVAYGVTSSPPIVSICIRANWKLPGVMNRYIGYETVGDMYVGWCVSGRYRMGTEFALSNPYFDFSHLERDEKEVTQSNLEE